MVRRWAGLKLLATYHPTSIDDIDSISLALKGYPFLSMENMRGWCKIWDGIANSWDHLMELKQKDDRDAIRQILREIASPYCANSITGDFSPSIYGKSPE
jgi:hypothetical protein